MKKNIKINFPYDPDTVRIIKEIEEQLKLPYKNIMEMKECEVHKYINYLTLLLIKGGFY